MDNIDSTDNTDNANNAENLSLQIQRGVRKEPSLFVKVTKKNRRMLDPAKNQHKSLKMFKSKNNHFF